MLYSYLMYLCASLAFALPFVQSEYVRHAPMPVLLFSTSNGMFNGEDAYHTQAVKQEDVALLFKSILTPSEKDQLNVLNKESSSIPEVLILLLRDSLRTDEVSQLKGVQKSVEGLSSYTIPHSVGSASMLSLLPSEDYTIFDSVESLKNGVDNSIFSNGRSDLVVVKGNWKLDEMSSEISELVNYVSTASKNDYVLAVTSNEESAPPMLDDPVMISRRLQEATKLPREEGKDFNHLVLITPQILFGIILSLFLLCLTCTGVTMLNDIQTPTKYSSVPPPHGKEY